MASPANPIPPGANPGTRYGRYTVLSVMQPGRKARVLCRCVCGTEKEVRLDGLKAGKVMSCGCLNTERRKDEKPSMQGAFADVLHTKQFFQSSHSPFR